MFIIDLMQLVNEKCEKIKSQFVEYNRYDINFYNERVIRIICKKLIFKNLLEDLTKIKYMQRCIVCYPVIGT